MQRSAPCSGSGDVGGATSGTRGLQPQTQITQQQAAITCTVVEVPLHALSVGVSENESIKESDYVGVNKSEWVWERFCVWGGMRGKTRVSERQRDHRRGMGVSLCVRESE